MKYNVNKNTSHTRTVPSPLESTSKHLYIKLNYKLHTKELTHRHTGNTIPRPRPCIQYTSTFLPSLVFSPPI